jgi:N-acetylglutamate synthase-like GNAT family acetyltransferase
VPQGGASGARPTSEKRAAYTGRPILDYADREKYKLGRSNMIAEITWDVTDEPNPAAAIVDAGLDAFNRHAADFTTIRRLACFARLPRGDVIGGAVGRYWNQACELQQIWVHTDHRRSTVGTRLVRTFEEAARRRGCTLVYLDTFSFQAPDFYRKLGYAVACELPGFPDGSSKFIMTRSLHET